MNKNTRIKLNDGLTMPVVALGVWQSHEGTKNAVLTALKNGYPISIQLQFIIMKKLLVKQSKKVVYQEMKFLLQQNYGMMMFVVVTREKL